MSEEPGYVWYVVTQVLFHPTDGSHRLVSEWFRHPARSAAPAESELLKRFEWRLASVWDAAKYGPLADWKRGKDYVLTIVP